MLISGSLRQNLLGQQHRGPTIHSNFMRPLCQRMQPTGKNIGAMSAPDPEAQKPSTNQDMLTPIIVLPDQENAPIHSVLDSTVASGGRDEKGSSQSKRSKRAEKSQKDASNSKVPKHGGPNGSASPTSPKARRPKQPPRARTPIGPRTDRSGNVVLFMPYLHYETHRKRKQMSEAIKKATDSIDLGCPGGSSNCDEMLIQAYLQSSHNLQIRRTLDQFYYHAISTEGRDIDQVVYRYTRDKGKEKMVFMVDQLWFWILSDDLIITSFPQRWNQPKEDPLNGEQSCNSHSPPYNADSLYSPRRYYRRHQLEDETPRTICIRFGDANYWEMYWSL